MFIRNLFIPNKRIISCLTRRIYSRRYVYLHKGSRVPGLKKDPDEVFVENNGIKYSGSEDNIRYIKDFLQDKFAISDELALQVITHKSFGNGAKPYNEKLSAMGSKLMNLYFAKYVTSKSTSNELAINGKNLDSLGSPAARELGGRLALAMFARNNNVNRIMFWKSYNYGLSFEASGEMKVSAQMMYALVGAVTFVHGKETAEAFIKEKLLDAKPSIEDITANIVEKTDDIDVI
ncbi:uncharacterized protein PRCAT00001163001 [Priceomyces carsonii]|uniref:uncharacterized protein n=1 Tax=Priceomyces carsonii TaxID=28549 RepID=UPI002ED78927|nr:unnamed protein product [Priceomyces carsonii]